jgi:hypothetical protein
MTSIDRQQAFSGTKEAATALRLDAGRLETYLNAQIKGFTGWRRLRGAMCCAASRLANSFHRRMRLIANTA